MTQIGKGTIPVELDESGLRSDLARVNAMAAAGLGKSGKDAGKKYNSGLRTAIASTAKSVFAPLATVGSAYAIGRIVKDSVQIEAAFSRTMRQVAAATRAPAKQIRELDRLAVQLGTDTAFSANEAADAMLQLAKGGLTPAQIQAGALKNTLTLAAAGGLNLASAADSVVGVMGAFELSAKDTDAAVAALAGSANASAAEVSDITQALAQVGTEAHNAGLSVQETTAILAAFSNAGINGSDAGTSLKTMLQRLVPQTAKAREEMDRLGLSFTKANGEFVSAPEMAERLKRAFKGMSSSERSAAITTIFGSDARRAANILANQGAEGLRKLIKETSDLEAAERMANASMRGTSGALERIRNAAETAQLQIGKALAPTLIDLSKKLADWVDGADIEGWTREAVAGIRSFASEVQPLAREMLALARDVGPLALDLFRGMASVVRPLVGAFNSLPGPVKELALALGAAALVAPKFQAFVSSVTTSATNMVTGIRNAETRVRALGQTMASVAGVAGMGLLIQSTREANSSLSMLESVAGGALQGGALGAMAGPWGAAIGATVGGLSGAFLSLTQSMNSAANAARNFDHSISGTTQRIFAARAATADYKSTLDQLTGSTTNATRRLFDQRLMATGVYKQTRNLQIAARDLVTAGLNPQSAAAKRVNAALMEGVRTGRITQSQMMEIVRTLGAETSAFRRQQNQLRHNINASKTWAQALKGLPKQVVTKIRQQGGQLSINEVAKLRKQYDLTPKEVRTIIKAIGADFTVKEVKNADTAVGNLNKKKAHPEIKASGVPQFRHDIDTSVEEVLNLDGLKATPSVSVNGASASQAQIQAVEAQLAALDGDTATTYIRTVRTGPGPAPNADGNIWEAYANGGVRENHVAQIAPAGAMRLWAEPETGGEAYIPLAPSKRKRSKAIWLETGRRLGLINFANGGITKGGGKKPQPLSDKVMNRLVREMRKAFGRRSPVVDAIDRWVDHLKKGELTNKALRKQLKKVLRHQIRPAIRQFNIGGGQSVAESRRELRELTRSLREVLGKNSRTVRNVRRLGKTMLTVARRQDKFVNLHAKAVDKLQNLVRSQRQYAASVRQAFTHDAFGGTAADLRLQLRADRNDARRATRQLRKLNRMGISDALFRQLAASGNTALIAELASMSPKQIRQFNRDFAQRNRALKQLGKFSGQKVFGDEIKRQRRVVRRLDRTIGRLNRKLERMERRIERAAARGTREGVRAGMNEHTNRAVRRRKSGGK